MGAGQPGKLPPTAEGRVGQQQVEALQTEAAPDAEAEVEGKGDSHALDLGSSAIQQSVWHGMGVGRTISEGTEEAEDNPSTMCSPPKERRPSKPERRPSTIGKMAHRTPIFIDPEEMKAKVRSNLIKPAYVVDDFYHKTGLWQLIARNPYFEQITLAVIMFNAVWIAIDTDQNDAQALLNADPIFQIAEHFFCVYFSFEWFVRFMAFRRKLDGLQDKWFVFDSSLVIMMLGETWIVTSVLLILQSENGTPGLGITSVLRLFRLLRLSRMARMLRSFPELMILVKGITAATRSVILVMLLLVIFMYIFAIAFTQLADGTSMGVKYFDTVLASMYSLLLYGTFLDNLAPVCMDIKHESVICLALFFVFILFSALTLMNMLIGVLCEMVSSITATERETQVVDFVTSKLKDILDDIDEDKNRRISRVEFAKILENPEAVLALDEVGVDPIGVVDFADFIFDDHPLQSDGLDFAEFMELVLKLRGSNVATVKDVVDLRKFVFTAIDHVQRNLMNPTKDGKDRKRMTLRRPMTSASLPNPRLSSDDRKLTRIATAPPGSISVLSFREEGLVDSPSNSCRSSRSSSPSSSPAGGSRSLGVSRWEPEGEQEAPSSPSASERAAERQAFQRLTGRVERLEESLTALLNEVKCISDRLPPGEPAPPNPDTQGSSPSAGSRLAPLPHLLHTSPEDPPGGTGDKRFADVLPGDLDVAPTPAWENMMDDSNRPAFL